MKISFFINRPPPFVGGLQNVCLRVAKRFQDSGARVRIVGFRSNRCGREFRIQKILGRMGLDNDWNGV